ncbi:Pectin lyase fold/virulence factor [Arabidopsis thaliana x Arabidopsis arenosa]|uniref:Pectin lyase fold/virulence factor n=1 Tax=Arabidopsis thaliana x Arabidopsis arenosa TaxID=1240361 RepID=A0A8T2E7Y2_9BRAS|nr:Pectin lyase fold/virulence factor [Arabidopsis thaliana x Arabidopsis arenosa]
MFNFFFTMKDFKTLFSLIIVISYYFEYGEGQRILSIKDFIIDTNHTIIDYSQAFQEAWKGLCEDETPNGSALVIRKNETYTLQPSTFRGPCVSSNIHIQIDGKLEGPRKPIYWKNKENRSWLGFKDVEGLVINGSGVLNPHGEAWWKSVSLSKRPTTISFASCMDIVYNGLHHINSPRNHISIYGCTNATLSNLDISAPEDSPNTDGINICLSHRIQILDSSIQTGDDCVAITGGRGGSSDINITGVACGPGHGISIGSLGKDNERDDIVENVNVRSCSFTGTQNGARIKTWNGGRGLAKNILYENITLIDAGYPIIINQHYFDNKKKHYFDKSFLKESGVKVDNITFRYFEGTSSSEIPIKLDCDETENCHNITMEHINITSPTPGKNLTAYCKFADVSSSFVNIDVDCNTNEDHQPHILSPLP